MLLVADSGSTKCDWILTAPDKQSHKFSTMGFNPFFHNEFIISEALQRENAMMNYANDVREVFFYGAGCSSTERNAIVQRGLQKVFANAKILVDHDLDGAAYATCDGKPGIACILGTGSNSCYFDGQKILEHVPALGYILGDEGSGCYFGKQLLAMFLYNQLPENIEKKLREEYHLSKEVIFENVYNKPNPNVYMASFMKPLMEFRQDEFLKDFVYKEWLISLIIMSGLIKITSMFLCISWVLWLFIFVKSYKMFAKTT